MKIPWKQSIGSKSCSFRNVERGREAFSLFCLPGNCAGSHRQRQKEREHAYKAAGGELSGSVAPEVQGRPGDHGTAGHAGQTQLPTDQIDQKNQRTARRAVTITGGTEIMRVAHDLLSELWFEGRCLEG